MSLRTAKNVIGGRSCDPGYPGEAGAKPSQLRPVLRYLVATVCMFSVAISMAQDPQTLLLEGNKAYSDGLYTDAVERYQAVTKAGWESPDLYYNLGNAYFKLNDYPHAILWYERALRLEPGNGNIVYNLNVTNSKIADKIEPLPVLFYVRWYQGIVGAFPVRAWAIQTLLFFSMTLAAILLYLFGRRLLLRKIGFWGAMVLALLTLFTFLFSLSGYRQHQSLREAIVFDPTITVKSSPDTKSIDLFVLHEGTKVQLIDRIGTWYEIRIANGSVGWLPAEALEEI